MSLSINKTVCIMTSKQSLIRVFRNIVQFYEKLDSEKEKLELFFQMQYFFHLENYKISFSNFPNLYLVWKIYFKGSSQLSYLLNVIKKKFIIYLI